MTLFPRPARLLTVVAAALTALTVAAGPAAATAPEPYTEPAFAGSCTWHSYGEGETPDPWLWLTEPVCVEYAKRDITFDNGGAVRFLLAEPARFALALPVCRYYQRDHWSVQSTTGAVPYVTWNGRYWFDKRDRRAAMRLTDFQVNGVSAGIGDVVTALRPRLPEVADVLAAYGDEAGETGLAVTLPFSLFCPAR
ncbi:hypothetical protein ACIP98_27435 [Streptomyces sp. NPDC088354]|uniref:hypothetical protein n=1 Tax=unclassified Streptomyces TaxID=2593676 RepID=UPI0029BC3DFE|nr:hypothetical protein [Streptomyces sp. MI02-7b]MDX3076895.1 hypothetical protein [Streptomyces sp. MI02-7b]